MWNLTKDLPLCYMSIINLFVIQKFYSFSNTIPIGEKPVAKWEVTLNCIQLETISTYLTSIFRVISLLQGWNSITLYFAFLIGKKWKANALLDFSTDMKVFEAPRLFNVVKAVTK